MKFWRRILGLVIVLMATLVMTACDLVGHRHRGVSVPDSLYPTRAGAHENAARR